MHDSLVFLKVKIKHLSQEIKIIKKEEQKAVKMKNFSLREKLSSHRVNVVSPEIRATLIAYHFLNKHSFEKCSDKKSLRIDSYARHRVKRLIGKYLTKDIESVLADQYDFILDFVHIRPYISDDIIDDWISGDLKLTIQ